MLSLPKTFSSTPFFVRAHHVDNLSEIHSSGLIYKPLKKPEKYYREKPLFLEGAINPHTVIRFFTEHREMMAVGCYRLQSSLVFGKGLVGDLSGNIFTGPDLIVEPSHLSSRLWRSPLKHTSNAAYEKRPGYEMRVIDEPAILLSKAADHIYGHWIVDILPRIEVAKSCGITDGKYILSKNTPTFAIAFLKLLGISSEQIIFMDEDTEILHCNDLTVPSVCRYRSIMSDAANGIYQAIINAALSALGTRSAEIEMHRKIYLSRKKWSNPSRRMVNAHEVEQLMSDCGFEIVYPETLTIAEQVLLFQQAQCVVGEGGSALHNTVFGKPGCRVGVLQGNNNGNFLQSALGDMKQQATGYFFGDSFFRPGNGMTGDFLMPIPYLKRVIQSNF